MSRDYQIEIRNSLKPSELRKRGGRGSVTH